MKSVLQNSGGGKYMGSRNWQINRPTTVKPEITGTKKIGGVKHYTGPGGKLYVAKVFDSIFAVDICIDVKELSVSFWFESVELVELIEELRKDIFKKQLESCQDFVIITK